MGAMGEGEGDRDSEGLGGPGGGGMFGGDCALPQFAARPLLPQLAAHAPSLRPLSSAMTRRS